MKKVIVEKLTSVELDQLKVSAWPIWNKEVSQFDWTYDSDEQCFILDGEVIINTPEGDFNIQKGDFVTFKKGLKCVWNVKQALSKHYNFL
jgi:uncharacterized cupin superfamily protein